MNSSSHYRQVRKNEMKALIIQIKKNKKETLSDADNKLINDVVSKYILLKHSHKSYMEYCSVYKEIQESLIGEMLTKQGQQT